MTNEASALKLKDTAHYRKAGYRFVYFTVPVYVMFFVVAGYARTIGLTSFPDWAFYSSMAHIALAELLAIAFVTTASSFSREKVTWLLWIMIINNLFFFPFWLYHLDNIHHMMYLISITSTIAMFTVANFWQSAIYNGILTTLLLTTAVIAKSHGEIISIHADIVYAIVFLIVALWLSFLANVYTKQRKRLVSVVNQLKISQEKLQMESQAKSDFLAKMSHEIRTPMNGVLGMIQLLKDDEPDILRKKYLITAHNSGVALMGVINDILDFSKIEAGFLDIESIDMDIHQLLSDCCDVLRLAAEEKGITLNCTLRFDGPRYVLGDPTRIRQIVLNLLSNAIKFTDKGGVELIAEMNKSDRNTSFLVVNIIDTGIGITDGQKQKLFQSFHQANSSTSREYGGTGLGLAICKQLTEMMGGHIEVNSIIDKGSEFSFTLPLPDSQHVEARLSHTHTLPNNLKDLHVAVVDDNAVNRMVINGLLDKLNIQNMCFDSGKAFLDYADESINDIDLIFMDCEMPELNGYQTAQRFRQLEKVKGKAATPIVALTAHIVKRYLDQCYDSGMDDVLVKPVNLHSLANKINQVIPTTRISM